MRTKTPNPISEPSQATLTIEIDIEQASHFMDSHHEDFADEAADFLVELIEKQLNIPVSSPTGKPTALVRVVKAYHRDSSTFISDLYTGNLVD